MTEASIPVDLFNPGQVFACLGFLEAADILLGDAEGGFDWSEETARFVLRAKGEPNPVEAVLEFLNRAKVEVIAPHGVHAVGPHDARLSHEFCAPLGELLKSDKKGYSVSALPIALVDGEISIPISNWLEGDGRQALKLFAGKQIGSQLATNMLRGDAQKPGTIGLTHIYKMIQAANFKDPFGEIGAVGGRFAFDARGAWDAIRIGMSLDKQNIPVLVSPCVEILAAIGLEHARPNFPSTYEIKYTVWSEILPVALARAALTASYAFLPPRQYRFFQAHLGDDKQYKKCFPAIEEPRP